MASLASPIGDDVPPSPGGLLGRRKHKPILPLAAFSTPPNTTTGEKFPLPPSPSTLHPEKVHDANVIIKSVAGLEAWKQEAGSKLGAKLAGVVLRVEGDAKAIVQSLSTSPTVPIISLVLPLPDNAAASPPDYIANSPVPISFSFTFTKYEPNPQSALVLNAAWALDKGHTLEIEVAADLNIDGVWENLEEFLGAVLEMPTDSKKTIVLSNILPPPHALAMPTVKLLNHVTYRSYQSHTATISLFPSVFVKFIPPDWDQPTPTSPVDGNAAEARQQEYEEAKKEWKRRARMYFGPVLEAFGYNRIIFGSSPSTASHSPSQTADWYEIARETVAELGVEQQDMDAVFYVNAKSAYGQT